ncbi:DUF3592 domain-containing protein [Sediminibacterium ginsengisoli]|uniref:DUF3592 domain-containing protein n=1 Tax=Sediminibacterium ginsengisoli TaxID=413434 RepID=A0A1T4LCD7_9BACT|nr:DUF3592 domain-containing protein [Sediminibacterium ginsengisoli]SJZ52399.1 hypothetical protein SAMN04488132_102432 [Sediminibacterium ginsengisoli]
MYLVCFGCYILFTRQPDYFDGEKTPAVIHYTYDSAAQKIIPKAVYSEAGKVHAIDARYVFRNWKEGERLEVIHDTAHPERAAVYAFWGYGITWGELIASVVLLLALFQVAVAVTKSPSPESLAEQLAYKDEKKPKYMECDPVENDQL